MSFSESINRVFEEKRRKRPGYSLRAFARSLDVDPSLLSKILNGKKQASERFIKKVGPQLGIDASLIALQIKEEKTKNNYRRLCQDAYPFYSDSIHLEILELAKTTNFINEPKEISKRLGRNQKDVKSALARLKRIKYIEDLENGGLELLSPDNSWVDPKTSSLYKKELQKNLLDKAKDAIDRVDLEKRENYSLSLACNEELLPEIKLKIKNFIRELDQFVEEKGNQNKVYHTLVSFFPVNEKSEEKS